MSDIQELRVLRNSRRRDRKACLQAVRRMNVDKNRVAQARAISQRNQQKQQ